MKKLLFALMISISVKSIAQKNEKDVFYKRPKLVVGIVVDQMRYDYLYRFYSKYSEGGFRRLLREGFSFTNANYNYVPTYTACGHACVYTGTTPSVNGIVSNDWYDVYHKKSVYCVSDSTVNPLGTTSVTGKMSPKNLMTSTLGDELKLSTNFRSKVIGIALKDRGSILPAGKGADAAYWHDPFTNNFISSTYYMNQLPTWVNDFNGRKIPDSLMNSPWKTLLPIDQYTESSADDTPYEGLYSSETKSVFPHDLPKIKPGDGELIRKIPFGDDLTEMFAESAIRGENLGKGSETDFLAISFTSTDYVGHMFGINAIELEDTYLRLDKNIADLLTFLDSRIGKDEYILFLTADHGAVNNPKFSEDHRLNGDFFEPNAGLDSLDKYLSAAYKDTNLVLNSSAQNIYLNHSVIESKKISLGEIQNRIAEYVLKFDGVAAVATASELMKGNLRTGIYSLIQNGFYPKRSADVNIQLNPGWLNWGTKTGTSHGSSYRYDTNVPMIFFGKNIRQGSSPTPVNVTDIAPTISTLLNMEFPSGTSGVPLDAILK